MIRNLLKNIYLYKTADATSSVYWKNVELRSRILLCRNFRVICIIFCIFVTGHFALNIVMLVAT